MKLEPIRTDVDFFATIEQFSTMALHSVIGKRFKKKVICGGKHSYRYTYLSPDIEVAMAINSEVVLQVHYSVVGDHKIDNFVLVPPPSQPPDAYSVFQPIDINQCVVVPSEISKRL